MCVCVRTRAHSHSDGNNGLEGNYLVIERNPILLWAITLWSIKGVHFLKAFTPIAFTGSLFQILNALYVRTLSSVRRKPKIVMTNFILLFSDILSWLKEFLKFVLGVCPSVSRDQSHILAVSISRLKKN